MVHETVCQMRHQQRKAGQTSNDRRSVTHQRRQSAVCSTCDASWYAPHVQPIWRTAAQKLLDVARSMSQANTQKQQHLLHCKRDCSSCHIASKNTKPAAAAALHANKQQQKQELTLNPKLASEPVGWSATAPGRMMVVLLTTKPSTPNLKQTVAISDLSASVRSGASLMSRGGGPRAPHCIWSRVFFTRFTSFSSSFRPCSALRPEWGGS